MIDLAADKNYLNMCRNIEPWESRIQEPNDVKIESKISKTLMKVSIDYTNTYVRTDEKWKKKQQTFSFRLEPVDDVLAFEFFENGTLPTWR